MKLLICMDCFVLRSSSVQRLFFGHTGSALLRLKQRTFAFPLSAITFRVPFAPSSSYRTPYTFDSLLSLPDSHCPASFHAGKILSSSKSMAQLRDRDFLSFVEDAESFSGYCPGGYHPVHLGERYGCDGRYKILHKLGNGTYSTVWLGEDLVSTRYVKPGPSIIQDLHSSCILIRDVSLPASLLTSLGIDTWLSRF